MITYFIAIVILLLLLNSSRNYLNCKFQDQLLHVSVKSYKTFHLLSSTERRNLLKARYLCLLKILAARRKKRKKQKISNEPHQHLASPFTPAETCGERHLYLSPPYLTLTKPLIADNYT